MGLAALLESTGSVWTRLRMGGHSFGPFNVVNGGKRIIPPSSGLETMHLLTQAKTYELRVDMEDFEGQKVFAHYSSFSVGPESEGYILNLGNFVKGAAGGTFSSPLLPHS